MTFDRAIRALLNGKAIRRKSKKYIRIGQTETDHWLEGPSGFCIASLSVDIDWITADDWECGTYNQKTHTVHWDNVVYDGHERPLDSLPNTNVRRISE
jgi:hypothetical protein